MRRNTRVASIAALAAPLVAAYSTRVLADDPPTVAQRCIYVDRIDQTRIVDTRTILFFMRGRTVFQNTLPQQCSGLRPRDGLRYNVVLNRLCVDDFVTQLVEVGGYAPGALCRIGMFVPITADEARALLPVKKSKRDQAAEPRAIESTPVELPPPASDSPTVPRATEPANPEPDHGPEAR